MCLTRRKFIRSSMISGATVMTGLPKILLAENLDDFFNNSLKKLHIAGIAVCTIRNNKINWSKGYGLANIDKKILMSPIQTIMNIGSISKTVTATAVMQLWEQGKFKLDENINNYLPFVVENPKFPGKAITFRQLLAHRSSIKDGPAYDKSYSCGDPTLSLKDWLQDYLVWGGKYFDKVENFHNWQPGETGEIPGRPRAYTNVGYGLLGYLVEIVSSLPFDKYCRYNIFEKLGMDQTSWYLSGINIRNHATPYTYIPANGSGLVMGTEGPKETKVIEETFVPNCLYSFPNYPDGLVRTSVNQLARLLIAYMQGGTYNGETILQKNTVSKMLSKEHWGQGLCWQNWTVQNNLIWGHGGGDPGISTFMMCCPAKQTGFVLFTNTGGVDTSPLIRKMLFSAVV